MADEPESVLPDEGVSQQDDLDLGPKNTDGEPIEDTPKPAAEPAPEPTPEPQLETTETTEPDDASRPDSSESESRLDEGLVFIAEQSGIPRQTAMQMGSNERLRILIQSIQQASGRPQAERQAAEAAAEAAGFKVDLSVDGDNPFDPDLVRNMQGMNDYYAKQVGDLQAQVQSLVRAQTEQAGQQRMRRFDELVAELDMPDIFGEGKSLSLDKRSRGHKNRVKLAEAMDAVETGTRVQGGQVPEFDQLFRSQARAVFGEQLDKKTTESVRSDIQRRLEDRSKLVGTRPNSGRTGGSGPAPTRAQARANVRERARQLGFS